MKYVSYKKYSEKLEQYLEQEEKLKMEVTTPEKMQKYLDEVERFSEASMRFIINCWNHLIDEYECVTLFDVKEMLMFDNKYLRYSDRVYYYDTGLCFSKNVVAKSRKYTFPEYRLVLPKNYKTI